VYTSDAVDPVPAVFAQTLNDFSLPKTFPQRSTPW